MPTWCPARALSTVLSRARLSPITPAGLGTVPAEPFGRLERHLEGPADRRVSTRCSFVDESASAVDRARFRDE
ncbi:hypothetical protein C487_06655 [Natrinema pallidum DSM 3751]|uniref:Uncharacterized protein n=1 Tax=Natrinema pallidum DSM 3751 TaxID=1227495 RepID=L9Z259_9EURY|nr:hypothetical protein C487_06655 [Natrinema pallidum DSM 3751]